MNNFTDMLSKAKEMQEKMKQAQEAIKKIEIEGSAGGDLVKVVLTGDYEIKSIIVSEEAKNEKQDIVNDLIKAAEQLQKDNFQAEIELFGSGPLEAKLRKKINDLSLNNIRLIGWTENLHDEFRRADVF